MCLQTRGHVPLRCSCRYNRTGGSGAHAHHSSPARPWHSGIQERAPASKHPKPVAVSGHPAISWLRAMSYCAAPLSGVKRLDGNFTSISDYFRYHRVKLSSQNGHLKLRALQQQTPGIFGRVAGSSALCRCPAKATLVVQWKLLQGHCSYSHIRISRHFIPSFIFGL